MRQLILFALAATLAPGCAARANKQAVATVDGRDITLAELGAALPHSMDTTAAGDSIRRAVLNGLVEKALFVQEAEREGLEKDIQYSLELEKKGFVTQELYNSVVAAGGRFSETELQNAYKMLENEVHVRVIAVKDEAMLGTVQAELARGVPFESVAVRYSTHASSRVGGDLGFIPLLVVEEPLRSKVLPLQPGGMTEPIFFDNAWQIVQLVERRLADPPPPPLGEFRQELEMRLKQMRRRELANSFLSDLRSRLEFNPAGLDIMCRPLDSISEADKEVWVAIKDKQKYVKVGRLLHLVARFPAALDTAMRKYTVRRTVEEDLLYEEALEKKLDELPDVKAKLERKRQDLLYQALYKREVTDKVQVSDAAVAQYRAENQSNFVGADPAAVDGMIRFRLQSQARDSLLAALKERLRGAAKVKIDDRLLAKAMPGDRRQD
jgi:parvulin-like peptidyl-prolyl isomerase